MAQQKEAVGERGGTCAGLCATEMLNPPGVSSVPFYRAHSATVINKFFKDKIFSGNRNFTMLKINSILYLNQMARSNSGTPLPSPLCFVQSYNKHSTAGNYLETETFQMATRSIQLVHNMRQRRARPRRMRFHKISISIHRENILRVFLKQMWRFGYTTQKGSHFIAGIAYFIKARTGPYMSLQQQALRSSSRGTEML